MESQLGVAFNDFVILATDKTDSFSIIKLKTSGSKVYSLGSHSAMSVCGEPGDTTQFAEYVQRNLALERIRDDCEVSPHRAFHWTRYQLAESIRSRNPYSVFILLAGYNLKEQKPVLYWLDYLGTGVQSHSYAAHGYGEPFAIGHLDRNHRPNMNEAEGVKLVQDALVNIQKRLALAQTKFEMTIIDKNGVRQLPDFNIDPVRADPIS